MVVREARGELVAVGEGAGVAVAPADDVRVLRCHPKSGAVK